MTWRLPAKKAQEKKDKSVHLGTDRRRERELAALTAKQQRL